MDMPESDDILECDRLTDFGSCHDNFLFEVEEEETDDLSEVR